ncbi:MAG: UDP-N-acetylmuramoyl-tripeptide--D-alanyl-D-alanine ligase [Firmicutes bacterium]|nr:UDP-N-acetylmuramoyl-tripeptide--D-alanyl-D-alanine ligase [Bacillota bacterium]
MFFPWEEVLKTTAGKLWQGKPGGGFQGGAIDSRQVKGGELFFPLPGEKENGHVFIAAALRRGAAGSLVEEKWLPMLAGESFSPDKVLIVVENSLHALHKIAAAHRSRFGLPVIAVTGSNGKTTTKDFIAAVLSTRYNVLKTEGNLNNHLGLPLMLLRLKRDHQAAVLELGMSGPGEIALLTALCRPSRGVITNVGEAHLEFLGSKENIAQAKGELLVGMGPGGKVFLNGDDPFLNRLGQEYAGEISYYGFKKGAALQALGYAFTDLGCTFRAVLPGGKQEEFSIPLPGKHNVYNALAAVAVGLDFSLQEEAIREGLAKSIPAAMRLEKTLTKSGFWVINDTYNANPTSVRSALQFLKEWGSDRQKIAVLGDMFELGPQAKEMHLAAGRHIAALGIDFLCTVGKLAAYIARGAREAGLPPAKVFSAESKRETLHYLASLSLAGSCILIKGSRGMQMEKIVEELLNRY